MTLRIVGAGMGRTGTTSLKFALERLLGRPCYHMSELFQRPVDVAVWHAALRGRPPVWDEVFSDYAATVDEPGTLYWRELVAAYPDAPVLLSTRPSDAWCRSMQSTVVPFLRGVSPPGLEAWFAMAVEMMDFQFPEGWTDDEALVAVYERHNDAVRRAVPTERLLEWRPGDGWAPLCRVLGVPEPADPFPHANTTAEFRSYTNLA